jgi:8-oxo-dGTP pyrophosphatase MutT (NUDIX family)
MLEQADRRIDGGYDVFGAAMREVREETNVRPDMVAEIVIVALVRDVWIQQPELLFEAGADLSREELEEGYRAATGREEHRRIEFVRAERDAIVPFLKDAAPVTPVAKAAALLFGRSRWGNAWYGQACRQVFGRSA